MHRLIFVSSMGIYDEVPGERPGSILNPYRRSAAIIEASDLDYTIVRPAWLNDRDEIAYDATRKCLSLNAAGMAVGWPGEACFQRVVETELDGQPHVDPDRPRAA